MGVYGTNLEGFGAFEGGVNSDKGTNLVSTNSDGETAILFGAAALREIQSLVANGDFATPPDEATSTITSDNPLPYWTFTDSSSGAITCAIVADATAGSGNVLRWSIAASTTTGKSVTLSRFVPVAATKNRAFAYSPEVNTSAATATTTITMRMQATFYRQDQTTTTGTTIDSGAVTFTTLGAGSNWLTGPYTTANNVPSDAAFCRIVITVATVGTTPASVSTADITEVRLIRGDQTNLFAEYTSPGTYAPTLMRQVAGELQISPNAGTGNVKFGGDITVSGGDINLSTTHIIKPLTTSTLDIIRTDTGTRSSLSIDRLFVGDQTSRYIDDDGTRTVFSGGIDVNASSTMTSAILSSSLTTSQVIATSGSVVFNGSGGGDVELTGTDTSVPISGNGELVTIPNTTTATTNSARWVLIAGNQYGLRRDSSTRRVKTNIVEADAAVLAAAKKLRAVHYEALEKDAEGNVVPSGKHTLGLIAEEIVEAGLGCAVTYDGEGLPDGYDERVLIAALLHRVNDLEERLKALESR